MLPVIFGSRPDHGKITFGWFNFKVIRIRAKYILAHGTEIKVPQWQVVRTSWSYCCGELLLGLWPYCWEILHVWSLIRVNTCFIRGHVFQKQLSWIPVNGFGPACASDGKKNWKIKQDSRVVDKEISALFVIDTRCEIRKVNNKC